MREKVRRVGLFLVALKIFALSFFLEGCSDKPTSTPSENAAPGNREIEFPLVLETRSFFDPDLENIEPEPGVYGFDFPIKADILASAILDSADNLTRVRSLPIQVPQQSPGQLRSS